MRSCSTQQSVRTRGGRKADSGESGKEMQNSEKHSQGNEHPAGSVDRSIFECSEGAWDSCADVSGADGGLAARGIAGPAVGGLGRSEPHVVHQQKRRAAGWETGHQHAKNAKFYSHSLTAGGHSETSRGRTHKASDKSIFVSVSAYRRDVGSGWLPQAARQDHQGDRRGACEIS